MHLCRQTLTLGDILVIIAYTQSLIKMWMLTYQGVIEVSILQRFIIYFHTFLWRACTITQTRRPIAFTTENNSEYPRIPYFSLFYSGACINKTIKNFTHAFNINIKQNEGVPVGKIFATMLLPASSALNWYATWLLSEIYIVWPFDPTPWVEGVSVGKMFATMLLPASSALIWYATLPYSEKN